ncbi:hypothetical protein RYR38_003255 [Edwardsiella piscicida]|nr:hypothetical protein [Edwardsiella piscicida]
MRNEYHVEIQLRSGEKKELTASARPDFVGDYFYVPMWDGYFSVLLSEVIYVETKKIADPDNAMTPSGKEAH